MSVRGEVLVAIINNQIDFEILRKRNWYRIPVSSVEKWLAHRWPPKWMAFYQTKVFGEDAHAVNYFGKVTDIRQAYRWQLFPDEERNNEKSKKRYCQIFVQPINRLQKPIYSRRFRRIVFIPTTWHKFTQAVEINDLYDESSLEDRLWAEFKRLKIAAERQEFVKARGHDYALDFAVYCVKGNIDVETDGDYWHANPEKAAEDNIRDNDLKTEGWKVLRFGTHQIQEETVEYCLPIIVENINKLGGLEEGRIIPRKISLDESSAYQLSMFDDI